MTCNVIRIKLPQGGGKSTIAAKLTAGDPKAEWICESPEIAAMHRKNNPTCAVTGSPGDARVRECRMIVIDTPVPETYIKTATFYMGLYHRQSTLVVLESI